MKKESARHKESETEKISIASVGTTTNTSDENTSDYKIMSLRSGKLPRYIKPYGPTPKHMAVAWDSGNEEQS